MGDIHSVILSLRAKKDLKKVPLYIALKLRAWIDAVNEHGLSEIRKYSGYHDEPLKGKRKGQRSIRLNRSFRAIYIIDDNNKLKFVEIIEVNNHEY